MHLTIIGGIMNSNSFKIIFSAALTAGIMLLCVYLEAAGNDVEYLRKAPLKAEEPDHLELIGEFDRSSDFLFEKTGTASYYGRKFHNRTTANGETFDMHDLTAAHKKLPFGTILRVTNLESSKPVLVRINDRGPYVGRRIIDLSYYAAKEIDGLGLPKVKMEGFVRDEDFSSSDTTNKYFFGYSYDKPLVCLPETVLNFIDSTHSFTEAVEKYEFLSDNYPQDLIYLMVPADETLRKDKSEGDAYYKLGVVKKLRPQSIITQANIVSN